MYYFIYRWWHNLGGFSSLELAWPKRWGANASFILASKISFTSWVSVRLECFMHRQCWLVQKAMTHQLARALGTWDAMGGPISTLFFSHRSFHHIVFYPNYFSAVSRGNSTGVCLLSVFHPRCPVPDLQPGSFHLYLWVHCGCINGR